MSMASEDRSARLATGVEPGRRPSIARPGLQGAGDQSRSSRRSPESAVLCLRCGPGGRVTRVATIFRGERDVVRVRGMAVGAQVGGVLPVTARAVRVSALARALAPPRRPRSAVVPAVLLGAVGLFGVVVAEVSLAAEGDSGAGPVAVMLAVAAVVCGALVWSRRHNHGVARRDVDRARWLWERCWYCRRCGSVSLLAPTVSRELPADGLAAAVLDMARQLRWWPTSTGGGGRGRR
jgi:hypothetical protein